MRKVCPERFQEQITRAGGLNRYGQPNFRLAWSQTETFRAGGVWRDDRFAGYREVYAANCTPWAPKHGYWMLMEWEAPERFGSEAIYYFLHRDESNGLSNLGPYPWRGRYQVALKLHWMSIEDGVMHFEPWPLNSLVIETIIPIVRAAKKDSLKRRRQFAEQEKLRADKKLRDQIEAVVHDSKRPLLLPSKIDDRIRLMEKQWAHWLKQPRRVHEGIQQVT